MAILKYSALSFLVFIGVFLPSSLLAQHPCNGRYTDEVFSNFTTSTQQYDSQLNNDTVLQDLFLRMYSPQGDTIKKRPAILVIHGGSFTGGSYTSAPVTDYCEHFTKRGYITVAMQYRLGIKPSGNFLVFLSNWLHAVYRAAQDTRSAISYLNSNADTLGIDTTQLFVGGFSAGGATAIHAAYWDQSEVAFVDTSFWGYLNGVNSIDTSSKGIRGLFSVGAGVVDTNILDNGTPAILAHGINDPIVPYGAGTDANSGVPVFGSQAVYANLQRQNTISHLYTIPGSTHVPSVGSVENTNVKEFIGDKLFELLPHNDTIQLNIDSTTLSAPQALAYQWKFNGDSISANGPSLTADTTGFYQLQMITQSGCLTSSSIMYVEVPIDTLSIIDTTGPIDTTVMDTTVVDTTIMDTTSVHSHFPETDSRAKVFPNPFNRTVNITSTYGLKAYSIYTVSGKLVQEETTTKTSYQILTVDWPPGTYFIKLEAKEGNTIFQKLVKQQ